MCVFVPIKTRYSLPFPFQAVYDVVLEAIFPICAITEVPIYANTMAQLVSGEAHREMWTGGILAAGSSAEQLAMKPGWGHPFADEDIMAMFGGPLGVRIPTGKHQVHEKMSPPTSTEGMDAGSCLEYAPEGCPPAYTRLRVTDIKALMEHPWVTADCVEESPDGNYWLVTTTLNEMIQWHWNDDDDDDETDATHTTGISGPAGQVILHMDI